MPSVPCRTIGVAPAKALGQCQEALRSLKSAQEARKKEDEEETCLASAALWMLGLLDHVGSMLGQGVCRLHLDASQASRALRRGWQMLRCCRMRQLNELRKVYPLQQCAPAGGGGA